MLRGILFDFDGVLGWTLEDHFKAWKRAAFDFNISIEPEDYFPLEGTSVNELAKIYCRKGRIDENKYYKEMVEKKEAYYLTNLDFKFYPGVEEFIKLLYSKNVPIAIVTAGLYDRIAKSVPENFLKKFSAVITSDRVSRGKPFPDPYLEAAKSLNLPCDECIVVENAPLGIQAAKVAGAYCIGVCSTVDKKLLSGADEIIQQFNDLKELNTIKTLLN